MSTQIATLTQSPLQYDMACELGAAPETVYAYVTDFPSLPRWMPMMYRCEVDNSNAQKPGEVGAVRLMRSAPGVPPTRETVRAFERNKLLAYSAADQSLFGMWTSHLGVITVEPNGRGGTTLRWLTYAKPGGFFLMAWIGRIVFPLVIRRSMNNLRKKFPA